ncbi:MAG: phosphate ABC transporter permease PstA [Armatimonadetes bacterium]|nr:phosphate ABC transporter permease PstA [Armatimonadota bacterium]
MTAAELHIKRQRALEKFWIAVMTFCMVIILLPVVFIFGYLIWRGGPALTWTFLTQRPIHGMREGGIFTPLVGTIYLAVGTMVISMPLGVLAAVYLHEFARPGPLVRLVRMAITNLAGVPSVVYGLFGLAAFVIMLHFDTSLIAGCCTLSLLVLPTVIAATEEALRQVPREFRLASLALGATRWQTVRRVVLPNALPGILTGTILSLSRAAGETAPILFTAAAYYLPYPPRSIFSPVMALPYHLYVLSTEVPDAPQRVVWGTALVLILLVFVLNAAAIVIRQKLLAKRRW